MTTPEVPPEDELDTDMPDDIPADEGTEGEEEEGLYDDEVQAPAPPPED